jgi:glycosyltransferase involved in cell wall biosynthesis
MPQGVSVAICTHNGAARLPETLSHLARQLVPENIQWELLVIDNASTDDTAKVALQSWPSTTSASIRVVPEPLLGLSAARDRAFAAAQYAVISFIDDDNWVKPDWVRTVAQLMAAGPEIGACGGGIDAVFEGEPPEWFPRYHMWFAVGEQAAKAGDITHPPGVLWGAGLSVRKAAWEQLKASGWKHLLEDRKGKALSTGGDVEICHALRLAGWKLWYLPSLRLQHFLPAHRLEWSYLRSVVRAYAVSSVQLAPYDASNLLRSSSRLTIRERWFWKLQAGMRTLLRHRSNLARATMGPCANWDEVIAIELDFGRLLGLLRCRGRLDKELLCVRNAQWRLKSDSASGGDGGTKAREETDRALNGPMSQLIAGRENPAGSD